MSMDQTYWSHHWGHSLKVGATPDNNVASMRSSHH
jgi:hypothetical protein